MLRVFIAGVSDNIAIADCRRGDDAEINGINVIPILGERKD